MRARRQCGSRWQRAAIELLCAAVVVAVTGAGSAFAQDSDGDGLSDSDETTIHFSDPGLPDTDGDGIGDGIEVDQGMSPISVDTDRDGVDDLFDQCPSAYDPLQPDSGTLGSLSPDGVGDLCQNADFDGSGQTDLVDVTLLRRALAGLPPGVVLSMPPRADPICPVDSFEPNELCGGETMLPSVPSTSPFVTVSSANLDDVLDTDLFRVDALETDSSCSCCDGIFCLDEDFRFVASLTVPPATDDYELCLATSCATLGSNCVTVGAGLTGSLQIDFDGGCGGPPDDNTLFVRVSSVGPATSCAAYDLDFQYIPGCF